MNYKLRTMNNEQRTNKAFTIIELMVAIALLAIVISFAGVIFKVSIEGYRTAAANTEIMQKLRAITDQLNADFKGTIWDSPGRIHFDFGSSDIGKSYINGEIVNVRADCIAFFANGDFQSTGQYGGKTVVGNVASIFYGQEENPDPSIRGNPDPSIKYDPKEKILVRRQTILTSDSFLPASNFDDEYCIISLAEWKVNPPSPPFTNPDPTTWTEWTERPVLDPKIEQDFQKLSVMYVAKGVDDFKIEFAQWDNSSKKFEWLPENELDFSKYNNEDIVTRAFKFTFTLYDSKDIIKGGRKFTHIVYLGN